ncbi:MAG: hypothetical protein JO311_03685 [Candidatus Eremiobacteraeota bacterium]|nr:hypothetical protein [Candidatus Eremiobacteraeota bacterium]MBV9264359.1 hypothetical protein [Candidatus Eremiobacteraeota bacterium]
MHSAIFALALLAGLLPATASPQVESTPIPAAQKPNFSSMRFMVGTWNCATKSARRPAAYHTTSTYTIDPDGYWIYETSVTAKVPWSPQTIRTWDHITYDTSTKRWVDVQNADLGGYALSFSKGWVGNQMTWHDVSFAPGPDVASQTDIVTTKVSDTKITQNSSFTERKTGRRVSLTTVCTKS